MTDLTRIAVLAGPTLARWEVDALERVLRECDATLSLVVELRVPRERTTGDRIRRALELREWAAVSGCTSLYNSVYGSAPEKRTVRLSDVTCFDGVTTHACTPSVVDGWKHRLPAETVETVADIADVALYFGGEFLTGPVLTAPTHGVLRFHHGDLREYRGQPPGFWEFVRDEPEAGVSLQRLTERLDGGEIVSLHRVPIDDARRWRTVRRRLYRTSAHVLADGVKRVTDEAFEPVRLSADDLGRVYTLPRGRAVGRFAVKTIQALLADRCRRGDYSPPDDVVETPL
ncbi:formyltransferase family protein [Haloarcula marina]|uniref:formyltransferase family protein n=1 Tax=Haloarcula marina TaxID=2961574 RepID=UPI0020B82B67|nr:formyltransferase family protein [Halomicroarcula marina]